MRSALLLLLAAQSSLPTGTSSFRTDVAPRVDPVFGDVKALRGSIDRFLGFQSDMEGARNDFSTAVHESLALLPTTQTLGPARAKAKTARRCPANVSASYGRALAAGSRYLAIGHQLENAYREIQRGDDLGDTQGLTPDYRWKAKHARELHTELVRDLREMRVAFYDQLGTELRFAGCKFGSNAGPGNAPAPEALGDVVDPLNPAAWDVAATPATPSSDAPTHALAGGKTKDTNPAPEPDTSAARAVWVDVDNTSCAQPSRVAIDGVAIGEVAAGQKTSVRTRAGPRELCLLPAGDARACGDTGTLRKTYFYEGLTLTVHCGR